MLCEEASGKLRRDIASGDSIDVARLIRFVVSPEGVLVPDIAHKLPGRGLWVKAARPALEIAVKRNIFSKAARRQVKIEPGLADLVHALLRRRCLDLLGLARREGGIVLGFEKVLVTVTANKAAWLIEASDGAEDGRNRILNAAIRQKPAPKLCGGFNNAELSLALGAENAIHAALIHGRRTMRWSAEMARLSGFEPLAPAGWSRGAPP
ncbi:MAG: RNA-binding protein [Asticcacaulis sp.]